MCNGILLFLNYKFITIPEYSAEKQKGDNEHYLLVYYCPKKGIYLLSRFSSETVNFLRPLALLCASTLRPFLVAILALKPCLLALFLLDG